MPVRLPTAEERVKLIKGCIQVFYGAAREAAYCPYSKFRVGAALLTTEAEIITGANVENASYGGAICAERTALVKAVSEKKKNFLALAVSTDVRAAISPCGICRQFIREFCSLQMPVYLVQGDWTVETDLDKVKLVTLEELLPYSFGPDDLDKPRI